MRKAILFTLFILISVAAVIAQVPTSGLLFHYPLDGNINDASGNGEDGYAEFLTFGSDRFGNENGAYFNQDGNLSGILNPKQYNNPQVFSICYWFKTDNLGTKIAPEEYGVISVFADGQTGTTYNHDRRIAITDTDPKGLIVGSVYTGVGHNIATTIPYDDNQWHHIVLSLSIEDGFEFYMDGNLVGAMPSVTSAQVKNGYWRFGGWLVNARNAYYGYFDDVRVYNRALSEPEIQALFFENGVPQSETVTIGDQVWMARNLNVGTRINGGVAQSDNGVVEKYCYENQESNCDIYGGLYQWDEMMQFSLEEGAQGVCPDGYHIPTMEEIDILVQNIGGYEVAGGALKEEGTQSWNSPNLGATNSSGLTVLSTGSWHNVLNNFIYQGISGTIPSSTELSDTEAEVLHLRYEMEKAYWDNNSGKTMGYPARCIQDSENIEEKDLIASYPFNGNANDESGNNYNGTVDGAILTEDRYGISNAAYDFEDWDDYIFFDNPPILNTADVDGITISHWFTMQSLGADYNFYSFLGDDLKGIISKYRPELRDLSVSFLTDEFIVEETMIANKWYSLIFTADFIDNSAKVYLNGQLKVDSDIESGRPLLNEFHVGRHHLPDGTYGWYFNGNIDDITIYNRPVSSDEVYEIYAESQCREIVYDTIVTQVYDTIWTEVLDTTWTEIMDTIWIEFIDTTYITVIDTITNEIIDTTYLTVTETISVTDTLIINAVLTGINPPDNSNSLKVYPNPAKDHVFIHTGDFMKMSGYRIRISSENGSVVFETNVEKQLYELNLSTWTGMGLYFIQLFDSGGDIIDIRKIILQ